MINKRNRANKTWRRMKSTQHIEAYKHAKATVMKQIRSTYWEYTDSILNPDFILYDLGTKPTSKMSKQCWSYVKSKKKDTCSVYP